MLTCSRPKAREMKTWVHRFQACCPLPSRAMEHQDLSTAQRGHRSQTATSSPWHQHKLKLVGHRWPTWALHSTDWVWGRNERALSDRQPLIRCRPHQQPRESCWQGTVTTGATLQTWIRSWRSVLWFPEGNGRSAFVWLEGHDVSWCNFLPAQDQTITEHSSLLQPAGRSKARPLSLLWTVSQLRSDHIFTYVTSKNPILRHYGRNQSTK